MEFSAENVQLQLSAFTHETPNQVTSHLNEDIAITTEKITDKPDLIEIEKQSVIQKKVITKEKILIPKRSVTSLPHQLPGSLIIDESTCCAYSEAYNNDREEYSKMETSSQGSADSLMEIGSQSSADSKMDIGSSSQDSDIANNVSCVQHNGQVSNGKEFTDPVEGKFPLQPTISSGIPRGENISKVKKGKKLKPKKVKDVEKVKKLKPKKVKDVEKVKKLKLKKRRENI